jgi:hypothetical protein
MKQQAIDDEFPTKGYHVKGIGKFKRAIRAARRLVVENKCVEVPEETTIKFIASKRPSNTIYELSEDQNAPAMVLDLDGMQGPPKFFLLVNRSEIVVERWRPDFTYEWVNPPTILLYRRRWGSSVSYTVIVNGLQTRPPPFVGPANVSVRQSWHANQQFGLSKASPIGAFPDSIGQTVRLHEGTNVSKPNQMLESGFPSSTMQFTVLNALLYPHSAEL